jgi:hypothetical protein
MTFQSMAVQTPALPSVRPSRALLVLAAAAALLLTPAVRADDATTHLAFSDPAKPGTLKIRVWHGNVSVHGADVAEVSVRTSSQAAASAPRADGLRVLTSAAGYTLVEKDNLMSLDYGLDGWAGQAASFDLTVPRATTVVVVSSLGGNLTCADLMGDVEIHSLNGRVDLENLTAGAIVETMNGQIHASVKDLRAGKPLSFTSMNGKIVILVPPAAKAAVRFRTHNGAILTDFDAKDLVTTMTISQRPSRKPRAAAAPQDAAADESDWKGELEASLHEAADQVRVAAREAAYALREGLAATSDRSPDLSHPLPPLPPMTGGRIVSGTLNGGGTEIQATTMNGDITFRKLAGNK